MTLPHQPEWMLEEARQQRAQSRRQRWLKALRAVALVIAIDAVLLLGLLASNGIIG